MFDYFIALNQGMFLMNTKFSSYMLFCCNVDMVIS